MLHVVLGRMYKDEKPYPVAYAGTSPIDADTDGDGVRDGADDQDHDGIPNFRELSRNMAAPRRAAAMRPTRTYGAARCPLDRTREPVQPVPAVHRQPHVPDLDSVQRRLGPVQPTAERNFFVLELAPAAHAAAAARSIATCSRGPRASVWYTTQ